MKSFALLICVVLMGQDCLGFKNNFKKLTGHGKKREMGQPGECPNNDCIMNFWMKYDGRSQDECNSLISETDACFAKVKDDGVCNCEIDEALESHSWESFLKDIYQDSYCEESQGCENQDTQKCVDSLNDAIAAFFTTASGKQASVDQISAVNEALACIDKEEYDIKGCGWDIATLRSDWSIYVPLYKAWLDGCDINPMIGACEKYLDNFDETLCKEEEFGEFAKCMIDQTSVAEGCEQIPSTVETFREVIFGQMVEDRCTVYDDLKQCNEHDKKMENVLSLLKKLLKERK